MKAGKARKPTSAQIQQGEEENANGKRGFRRRIQFRQTGDEGSGGGGGGGGAGGEGGGSSRAEALDNAQIALESFYASFPVVPLLSVAHAKVKK